MLRLGAKHFFSRNFSTKLNEISNLVKVSKCMIAARLCLLFAYINIFWLKTYDILDENDEKNNKNK